eukprot:c19358_g1_i1 orf=402-1418(-)
MGCVASPDSIRQLRDLIEEAITENLQLGASYKNLHQGYPDVLIRRFLQARENNVSKAFKMLLDCLHWRVNNGIDDILSNLIEPKGTYDTIRASYLIGMTGFCKQGRPVFALGVGLSSFDKAPVDKYVQSHIQLNEYRDRVLLPEASKRAGRFVGTCLKILDMTNLKLSALNTAKILITISTVDDLNYPEKTDVYYIVNAPYIFSACWKVVRPLLQERTKRKVQVLQGSGREELLKVMDYDVLPHFCKSSTKQRGSSSSKGQESVDCYSPLHPFHVEVWNYIKQHSYMSRSCVGPTPQTSYHVHVPDPAQGIQTIESELVQMSQDACATESSKRVLDDR